MIAEVLKSKLSKDCKVAFPIISLKIIKSTQILIITNNSPIAWFTLESIILASATHSRGIILSLVPTLVSFQMLYSLFPSSWSLPVSSYTVKIFCDIVTLEYLFSSSAEELYEDGLFPQHSVSVCVNVVCIPTIFLLCVTVCIIKIIQGCSNAGKN